MSRLTLFLAALSLSAIALHLPAQTVTRPASPSARVSVTAAGDTAESGDADVGEGRRGFQYGLASGALHYSAGRSEQALGAVLRWVPVQWLSLSVTPTAVRVSEPATSTLAAYSGSGLVDLPLEASVSHSFKGRYTPTVSAGMGVSLPVGDSASGFGSGAVGYSATIGAGFTPTENFWVHGSAGRSLSGFSMQSAYTDASGWADLSGGTNLTEKVSVGAGYSTDIGTVPSTEGRSSSVSGNLAVALYGATTLNMSASHGLSGLAPEWSLALGVGTAFPYLSHLGAGSALDNLRNTFGGGSHGLGGRSGSGSGRGRKP